MDVFLLWHTYDLKDDYGTHEEIKLIGVFSTEEKAEEVIALLKDKDGFRDLPVSCFTISKYRVDPKPDRIGWAEGFFTARWVEE